jgi:hypothetical protein
VRGTRHGGILGTKSRRDLSESIGVNLFRPVLAFLRFDPLQPFPLARVDVRFNGLANALAYDIRRDRIYFDAAVAVLVEVRFP